MPKIRVVLPESITFPRLPEPGAFVQWREDVERKLMTKSKMPQTMLGWLAYAKDTQWSVHHFTDPRVNPDGTPVPEAMQAMDALIREGLDNIIPGGRLQEKIRLQERAMMEKNMVMTGRQMLVMVYEHYEVGVPLLKCTRCQHC